MAVYHLVLAGSLEERMVRLRDRLAEGRVHLRAAGPPPAGGGGGAGAGAAAEDANASLLAKLPAHELMYLLAGGRAQAGRAPAAQGEATT